MTGHWVFCDIYVWEKFYHNAHRLCEPSYASVNTPWHKILNHIVHRDILCFYMQSSCQYSYHYLCWTCVHVNICWPTESDQNYLHIYMLIQNIVMTKFVPRDAHVLHTGNRTFSFEHRKPFQHLSMTSLPFMNRRSFIDILSHIKPHFHLSYIKDVISKHLLHCQSITFYRIDLLREFFQSIFIPIQVWPPLTHVNGFKVWCQLIS